MLSPPLKAWHQHFNASNAPARYVSITTVPLTQNVGDRGSGMLGVTISAEGDMAGNQLFEWELREFTGADSTTPEHRHVWETVYFILKGKGDATLQKEGGPERRLDWKEGDMFLVEANEYHNHRPVSQGARFLQFKASGYFRDVGIDKWTMQNKPGTNVNIR